MRKKKKLSNLFILLKGQTNPTCTLTNFKISLNISLMILNGNKGIVSFGVVLLWLS